VSVSKRAEINNCLICAISSSRPMKLVSWSGRLSLRCAQHLAQRRHVHLQCVGFDHHGAPHERQQLLFGDEVSGPLHEHQQQIEGVRPEAYRLPVDEQPTLHGLQLEAPESIADCCDWRAHNRRVSGLRTSLTIRPAARAVEVSMHWRSSLVDGHLRLQWQAPVLTELDRAASLTHIVSETTRYAGGRDSHTPVVLQRELT
jgi:hypothetical protein